MMSFFRLRLSKIFPVVSGIAGVLLCISCAPRPAVETGPSPEFRLKIGEANLQAARGCYVGFKTALRLYGELYAQPALRTAIAPSYLRTLLLMIVREREIGILNSRHYQTALAVIKDSPTLGAMEPLLHIAQSLSPRTRGIMTDIDPVAVKKVYDQLLVQQVQAGLKAKALLEDYYAYIYAAFFAGFGLYADKKDEFAAEILNRYPESILLRYKNAIYPRSNSERLKDLLDGEPEFYEAEYNLGELALGAQNLVEAESHFLKSFAGLAESPQVTIYLGSIYLATEEFDKSLEFYDKTLVLTPEYRDALLGKGICLSTMGLYTEAIQPLAKIVKLGYYMLGESHYWLAWNYHALKDEARAQAEIEESKSRLPTNSEVFGLSGTIALQRGENDRGEIEFLEALKYNNSNAEALFGLGRTRGQKGKWEESGVYYESAASVLERSETAIGEKIDQIRKSGLSDERQARLVAKKEQQLKIAQATKATAFYSAAASYVNTGLPEPRLKAKALDMAGRAAEHGQFKEKAEELIKLINR